MELASFTKAHCGLRTFYLVWHKPLLSPFFSFSPQFLSAPNIFLHSFCSRPSSSSPFPPLCHPNHPTPPLPPVCLFTACYLYSAVDCFCPLGVSTRLILHSAIQPPCEPIALFLPAFHVCTNASLFFCLNLL